MSGLWRATREWEGETVFIIGGGSSVASQNLELLRGRRIIAINSSYEAVPFADFVIFSDSRWWSHHCIRLKQFKGRIVSASSTPRAPNLLRVNRKRPPGLATDQGTVTLQSTTLSGAINLVVHLGVNKIILLGIDGKAGANGKTHHHAPHPWKQAKDCWQKQRGDLVKITDELKALGIECVNASPGSAWDLWPIVRLEDHINEDRQIPQVGECRGLPRSDEACAAA